MLNYRRFLEKLHGELQEALAEVENLEFHHMEPGTTGATHYTRLATWLESIEERIVWYESTTGKRVLVPRI